MRDDQGGEAGSMGRSMNKERLPWKRTDKKETWVGSWSETKRILQHFFVKKTTRLSSVS